jgi:hypothetical protein
MLRNEIGYDRFPVDAQDGFNSVDREMMEGMEELEAMDQAELDQAEWDARDWDAINEEWDEIYALEIGDDDWTYEGDR